MNRLLISATIFSLSLWATGCKNDHKDTERYIAATIWDPR